MELKTGYKQTDVVVIPEDWDTPTLGELFSFKNGLNKAKGSFGRGTPIVNYMDVYGHPGIHARDLRGLVEVNKGELESLAVKKGDVFFTRTSETVAEVGIASVMLDDSPDTVFSGFILRARPLSEAICDQYKKYCFSSDIVRKQITSKATYTTRALTSGRVLSAISLPLPPTKAEQEAIARVLSDADAFIQSLERLIIKKRDIKQGTMRELLTGKKCLPGFGGKWEVRMLGEIARVTKGIQLHSTEMNSKGLFAHLNGGMAPSGYTDRSNTPGDTIAISEGGNSCGYVQFMAEPYWCGGHCYSVVPNDVDNSFLYQALKVEQSSIMGLRVGSGLPNVQKTALLDFKIHYPADRTEQSAIATVLSEMDAEIAALEAKLSKVRLLRQGMLEPLLTGRIRLA